MGLKTEQGSISTTFDFPLFWLDKNVKRFNDKIFMTLYSANRIERRSFNNGRYCMFYLTFF